jgi:hypothetical protein
MGSQADGGTFLTGFSDDLRKLMANQIASWQGDNDRGSQASFDMVAWSPAFPCKSLKHFTSL